ncbi:MAG: hypothetical protein A2091_05700 [Desulfuromonadales bacterium GWD2_61_12]|nr:MAG: hypothetical protein A2005_10035 [Desulfuromonadales bacterium GWC2_61_20]OGR32510.1 MAG: hypothetical protein A2091_05700 [Desulfuromonadales bacterium GWD2_61_12]HAD04488.1 hypothetical protein [Desulfuromonas sp.]HBT83060.1 hypothetical protein [Desulfuromonas sp.]
MRDIRGWLLGASALFIYLLGGLSTFGGIALIVFMKGRDLLGWGDGRSIGYLFLCVGLALSVLGVLLMRILRNRRLA